MKRTLCLILLTFPLLSFRLSRLLSEDGDDAVPTAFARWENSNIRVAVDYDTSATNSSMLTCSNITDFEGTLKRVFSRINSIPESDITLSYVSSSDAPHISVYSYTAAEWSSYMSSWGASSSTLGQTRTNATCKKETVCYYTSVVIRMNCEALGDAEANASIYDFESVFQHELIHGLGIDHSANTLSLMYPLVSTGVIDNRLLTPDDEAGLIFLYPKQHAPSPLAFMICGSITKVPPSHRMENLLILTIPLFLLLAIKGIRYRAWLLERNSR